MGTESIAKYVNVRTVLGVLVLVIVSLCGTIIVLKDGAIADQIDKKVKYALDCAKFASAEAVERIDKEKLSVAVYVADQRRVETHIEEVKKSIEKIDKNVDMLIRMQLQGKKALDIDRERKRVGE